MKSIEKMLLATIIIIVIISVIALRQAYKEEKECTSKQGTMVKNVCIMNSCIIK